MAAEETLTWEIPVIDGGARRPTLADLGGADFLDDDDYPPPRDGSEPYATEYNQTKKQIRAVASVAPSAILTVGFAAGVPFLDKFMAPSSDLVAGDFTIGDASLGVTTIEWPAGSLPEMVCDPMVSVNQGTQATASVEVTSPTEILVRTNSSGSPTDLRFTVAIY